VCISSSTYFSQTSANSNSLLADALWDHVTFDDDELDFVSGDVVEVIDLSDKDWWYGEVSGKTGWFPSSFVMVGNN